MHAARQLERANSGSPRRLWLQSAPIRAIADAGRKEWLPDNADAFADQRDGHEGHGYQLADTIAMPVRGRIKGLIKGLME
jgi:hypothetical protein